jgi:hypothetical protein
MRPKLFVLTAALGLAAGFAGQWLAARPGATAGVEATASAALAEGERWEYCAVSRAQFPGSVRGGQYWITYFRANNVRVDTIEAGVSENALSKAIYRLGEEGWEMVGQGTLEAGPVRTPTTPTPTALYFKRPRRE